LLQVHEYWAKYNQGESVPFIDHGTCYGYYTEVAETGRTGTVVHSAALNEMIHGAYAIRKGLPTPYGQTYYDNPVDEGNVDSDILVFLNRKDGSVNSSATPAAELPVIQTNNAVVGNSLTSTDIGNVNIDGSTSFNDGTFTLSGSGDGISLRPGDDDYHYAYQSASGDSAMVARVTSISGNDGEACVLLKESIESASSLVRVCARPNEGAHASDIGKLASDGSGSQTFPLAVLPLYLKVERQGDNVAAFVGPDGVTWAPMHHWIFDDLPDDYFMGLAVTSRNNSELATATFTDVRSSE